MTEDNGKQLAPDWVVYWHKALSKYKFEEYIGEAQWWTFPTVLSTV